MQDNGHPPDVFVPLVFKGGGGWVGELRQCIGLIEICGKT